MTVDTFFEEFEEFADAPGAVERMRELVLSFAVTGRLVSKVQSEAPVSDLIASLKIEAEKTEPQKKKKADSESKVEHPFEVPDHWAWIPLNELGDFGGGMTPSKSKSAFWDGDINWFSSRDIKNDYLEESSLKISEEGLRSTRLHLYPPGCLFIVGRSGILKHTLPVSINLMPGASNQDLKVLQPHVEGMERYLQIMLKGMNRYIITELVKTGMTVQSLKYDEFVSHPFPLPPLAEQKRIVAKVDELMALCDQLKVQQQERDARSDQLARASLARFAEAPTPVNLNFLFHPSYTISPADLRKSILTLAFDGFLTSKRSRGREIPRGWKTEKIASLCVVEDGDRGKSYPKKAEFSDSGHCIFLNAKNVTKNGFNFSTCHWIDKKKHQELRKGTLVRGDVVFTSRGTLGNIAHYDGSVPFETLRINSGMFILRDFQSRMDAGFLTQLLRSPQITDQIAELQSGSAQPQLPIREFKKFEASIPPLAEQKRIVVKVNELMALVDELETQLNDSRATAKNLLEALVAELTAAGAPNRVQSTT